MKKTSTVKGKIQRLQSFFDFDRFILKLQAFEVLFEQRSHKLSVNQKIRYCFFRVYQAKVADCIPASAAAQHIEASIKRER